MITNYRGKNTKDTEDPFETPVLSSSHLYSFINATKSDKKPSVTEQQIEYKNFDNYVEKRK